MILGKLLVFIGGIIAIVFTYWFFLMKKSSMAIVAGDVIDIIVKGGYTPDTISLKQGTQTTLTFIRQDPGSCLEEVVLADFGIRKTLPLNERVAITITPEKTGEYKFSCGMGMFHGKIIVNE